MWNEDKIRPAADSIEGLKIDYFNVIEQEMTEGRVMGSLSLRRHTHGPMAKRLMHMVHLSGNT